jgi:hypothetical protein
MKHMAEEMEITIESLAWMVKEGFDETAKEMEEGFHKVHEEMATKKDVEILRGELREELASKKDFEYLRESMREDVREELGKYKYAKEIDGIRQRVEVCEEKLRVKRRRDFALD